MASPLKSDVEVWIARLPGFELRPPRLNGDDPSVSELAVFDHLSPHSFIRLDEFPAVLCRDMTALTEATHGQMVARVLKADPARPWPQPPWRRRTTGARFSLLVAGTAWFDLGGVGEESFSANDSWCLPDGLDHVLLEASTDFELLEIEFPVQPSAPVLTSTIPEMLMLYATYSHRPTPYFGMPAEATEGPLSEPADPGIAPPLRLDDKACSGWTGCPWHLHDHGVQCGYLTSGTAQIDADGVGVVDARPGTFWLQQSRHAPALSAAGLPG